ncbi:MAG: Histidine kinase [Thermoanaerobacterales bacterium 50_218]|nr:MAG: Histidine kinase [Thermoanaerobacterales bacterium 50_218]
MIMSAYRLIDVVDRDRLQEILDKFTEATGVAAVLADLDGRNITEPSNFTRHCTLVRSTDAGARGCHASDASLGRLSLESGGPTMALCHCGIVDLGAPIVIDGVCYGYVLCGQVLLEAPRAADIEEARKRALRFGLDPDIYVESFLEIEVVPEHRVRAAAEMLHITANYIVEMGISRLTQKKLLEEDRKLAELERTLRSLEFKALKSQVNPHFLFNALNTAVRLAYMENATRTREILYSLASLLRYSLRNQDKLVRLRDEIAHVKHYLYIQEMRYKGKIKVTINIPQALDDVLLPVMSLQPLVENAVIHGLENKPDEGELRIIAYELPHHQAVRLEIIDNGVGIRKEILEKLRKAQNTNGCRNGGGLGILNVDSRFKQYFGPDYGLEIYSEEGKGTRVVLTFPRVFDVDNERGGTSGLQVADL